MKKYVSIFIMITFIFSLTVNVFAAPNIPKDEDIRSKRMRIRETSGDFIVYDGKRIPTPLSYNQNETIFQFGEGVGGLKEPEQIFIDEEDKLYIVDSGNNRIIKLDRFRNVEGIYTGPDDKPFKTPKGIFVDSDGSMFIADTGNSRIVHLGNNGEYVEEFIKPNSQLIEEATFEPVRIAVNHTGLIYVLNQANFRGFMVIDGYNEFRGYVAATTTEFDLMTVIWRKFGTEEQKRQIAQSAAPPYSSFVIDDSGIIYATTVMVLENQIVKLNSVGENIYKPQAYGGQEQPNFVDISVNKYGIISVLDSVTRRVYQYDQQGNMVTSFGGKGNWNGKFERPVSFDQASQGNIYVLDGYLNQIQVFEPTNFIKLVQEATKLHLDGEYEKAMDLWEEVMKIDSTYQLAFRGMAKTYTKREQWKEAIKYYKLGNDKEGYTIAFAQYRHQLFRDYFGWILLVILGIIVFIVWLGKLIREYANYQIDNIKI